MHAGAIGPVRREVDLDHRIVEADQISEFPAYRRVGRKLDDALVIFREFELARRAQHAAALDAADFSDLEIEPGARNVGAGRREHALHGGARVGRAAHDLHRRAGPGIDQTDTQTVGVGMLLRRDHAGDRESRELLRLVLDALDLEPDHGETVDDRVERSIGVEMLFEPGDGEFHVLSLWLSVALPIGTAIV